MNESTLLLRQINPGADFINPDGSVRSSAFNPSKAHDFQLSVYDGDQIDAKSAWEHFTRNPKLQSVGVMAVSGEECETLHLDYRADPEAFKEHVLIDFKQFIGEDQPSTQGQRKAKAKLLRQKATQRGWCYQAPALKQP